MSGNNTIDYKIIDIFSEKYNLTKNHTILLIDILNTFTIGHAFSVTIDDQIGFTHISAIMENL